MDWDINNIKNIVNYINEELLKGRSQKDIEINDFKVAERVIAKRLHRLHYKKQNNQWIYVNDTCHTATIQDIEPINEENKSDLLNIFNDSLMKNNLINLLNNYDKIMNIINKYDTMYDRPSYTAYDQNYNHISIELPIDPQNDYRTTIRVNSVIWNQFTEFADNHKEFTKKDLLSQALKEYISKYTKY